MLYVHIYMKFHKEKTYADSRTMAPGIRAGGWGETKWGETEGSFWER